MNKRIIAIFSAITVVLLAAVITLACILLSGGDDSKSSPMEEYYALKCESFATQNTNLAKGQIVFLGDSITDLYVLDDHYSSLPLATYNRGIGGDTTKGLLDRLRISAIDLEPSKIVLMIGTNDINGGTNEGTIIERYETILDKLSEKIPGCEIICISIIPQNSDIETYSEIKVNETTEHIISVNAKIEALAKSRGLTYVDLFSHLSDENNHLIEKYSDDGLHLNNEGLKVWTKVLMPYLNDNADQ